MFGFPLLLIPLAICNIIIFLMPGVSFSAALGTLTLVSGVAWTVTLADALLALGVLMLMFEVIKGARPGGKYFTDHFLALLVFAGAAAEFVMLPQFGTSTFFLLALLALVDFLSGLSLRARRPRRVVATVPAAVPVSDTVPAAASAVHREPNFTPAVVPVVPKTVAPAAQPVTVPHPVNAPVTPAAVAPVPTPSDLHAHVEPIVADDSAVVRTTDRVETPTTVTPVTVPPASPTLPR